MLVEEELLVALKSNDDRPADPLEAAVIKPFALTVILALVNEPTLLFTVSQSRSIHRKCRKY